MEKDNKILFLDFDGVLFDTLKEVYLVNRAIYKNISFLEEVDKDSYALFSKYKYLVYNIWMFYYYNPLIFDNKNNIEEEFIKSIQKRDIEKENKFLERFLEIRKDLSFNHHEYWKNLEIPYDFFFEIKKLYDEKNINLAIVSKKNKNAILERFKTYNFNLDEKYVFAREILDSYPKKADFMEEYMKLNNFTSAIFVDDNPNNLTDEKKHKNIKSLLALWGNSGKTLGYSQEKAIEEIKNYFISK